MSRRRNSKNVASNDALSGICPVCGGEMLGEWCLRAEGYPHPPHRACGYREPGGTVCTQSVDLSGLCLHCKLFTNHKLGFDGRHYVRLNVSDEMQPVPREESLAFIKFLSREFRTMTSEERWKFVAEMEAKYPDHIAMKKREKSVDDVPF